jgi:hypothetical protein
LMELEKSALRRAEPSAADQAFPTRVPHERQKSAPKRASRDHGMNRGFAGALDWPPLPPRPLACCRVLIFFGAKSRSLSSRDFLALLARFRQVDRDGLLAALDLPGFAAAATVRRAALIAMHFAFHVAARAARVSAFSLCHKILQEFFRSCEGYCRRAGDPRSHADKLSSQRHGRRADRSASLKTTKL